MKRKILFLSLIASISLASNVKFLSLKQFLNDYQTNYNKIHNKKIYFILTNKKDILNVINIKREKKLLNYKPDTLIYFLEQITGGDIKVKKVSIDNETIYILSINKNKKNIDPFKQIIKKLEKIKQEGLKLELINPDFNSKDFNSDMNAIILKLKEYDNLK